MWKYLGWENMRLRGVLLGLVFFVEVGVSMFIFYVVWGFFKMVLEVMKMFVIGWYFCLWILDFLELKIVRIEFLLFYLFCLCFFVGEVWIFIFEYDLFYLR